MAWLLANWVQVLVALLAIDQALIPLFPKVPIFTTIKNIVGQLLPKQQ